MEARLEAMKKLYEKRYADLEARHSVLLVEKDSIHKEQVVLANMEQAIKYAEYFLELAAKELK